MTLQWRNAKTYPDAPHEYVLFKDHPKLFAKYVRLIKSEGVNERFTLRGYMQTYRYYYGEDGYKYWVMEDVLNCCKANPQPTVIQEPHAKT